MSLPQNGKNTENMGYMLMMSKRLENGKKEVTFIPVEPIDPASYEMPKEHEGKTGWRALAEEVKITI
jgi:hypothetical protein